MDVRDRLPSLNVMVLFISVASILRRYPRLAIVNREAR